MVIEYSTASEYTIDKKVFHFLAHFTESLTVMHAKYLVREATHTRKIQKFFFLQLNRSEFSFGLQ